MNLARLGSTFAVAPSDKVMGADARGPKLSLNSDASRAVRLARRGANRGVHG
jgi:hypothetical protein